MAAVLGLGPVWLRTWSRSKVVAPTSANTEPPPLRVDERGRLEGGSMPPERLPLKSCVGCGIIAGTELLKVDDEPVVETWMFLGPELLFDLSLPFLSCSGSTGAGFSFPLLSLRSLFGFGDWLRERPLCGEAPR